MKIVILLIVGVVAMMIAQAAGGGKAIVGLAIAITAGALFSSSKKDKNKNTPNDTLTK